jgi:hypothetical protein
MISHEQIISARRPNLRATSSSDTQRWHREPMTVDQLRSKAMSHLGRRAVARERLRKYEACWDAATYPGSHAPLPCPECFSKSLLSPLRLTSGPADCVKCGTSLEFRLAGVRCR